MATVTATPRSMEWGLGVFWNGVKGKDLKWSGVEWSGMQMSLYRRICTEECSQLRVTVYGWLLLFGLFFVSFSFLVSILSLSLAPFIVAFFLHCSSLAVGCEPLYDHPI